VLAKYRSLAEASPFRTAFNISRSMRITDCSVPAGGCSFDCAMPEL
jgi:hypothetical protein